MSHAPRAAEAKTGAEAEAEWAAFVHEMGSILLRAAYDRRLPPSTIPSKVRLEGPVVAYTIQTSAVYLSARVENSCQHQIAVPTCGGGGGGGGGDSRTGGADMP